MLSVAEALFTPFTDLRNALQARTLCWLDADTCTEHKYDVSAENADFSLENLESAQSAKSADYFR